MEQQPNQSVSEVCYDDGKGWFIVIERPYDDNLNLSTTVWWDHLPTEEEVTKAGEIFDKLHDINYDIGHEEGMGITINRGKYFITGKDVSPPYWRWPKINIRFNKPSIHIGWRYTAYWITWSRSSESKKDV